LTPASLAILQASFRPDDRARAIGAWSGLSGVASAAGPLVGGYLLSVGSWRWIFFINLPVAAVALWFTAQHVPESRDPTATGRVDTVGAALAVIFLAGLTYGLIEAPTRGWSSPAVVACLAIAAVAAPTFYVVEQRRSQPMLPLKLFRSRQFSGANGVTFAVYGALGGALFLLPVELQIVKGYSPLESGISLLPLTLVMLTLSARSGALSARIGPRLQMTVGPLVVGGGLALLTRATEAGSYWTQVFPAVLLFAIGLAITVAPLTATAMGAAPPEHSGVASAINNVVARAAGLLAVAVLPLLAGLTGAAALSATELASGFRTAMLISGVVAAIGGVLAALTIRNPARTPAGVEAAEEEEPTWHCGVSGPPLNPSLAAAGDRPG
jgi:MFS family permease